MKKDLPTFTRQYTYAEIGELANRIDQITLTPKHLCKCKECACSLPQAEEAVKGKDADKTVK